MASSLTTLPPHVSEIRWPGRPCQWILRTKQKTQDGVSIARHTTAATAFPTWRLLFDKRLMKQEKPRKPVPILGKLQMMKVILILECDLCHEPFDRIGTSTDRNPATWGYLLDDLEAQSLNHCWSCRPNHYCPSCFNAMPSSSEQNVNDGANSQPEDF